MTTPDTSSVRIDVYDGNRNLMSEGTAIQYRLVDGNQDEQFNEEETTSSLTVDELPFFDNFGDGYAVIVSADGYRQAGFVPVTLTSDHLTIVDLMLLPNNARFDFSQASWEQMKIALPFLANGVTDAVGRTRYMDLMASTPEKLAALLNITTAMRQINLPHHTPLDYLKQIKWDDSLAQDRFFAYCDPTLLDEVSTAADQGEFAPEIGSGFLHPGATASWKQVQFGEANVQLTFHEEDHQTIDGLDCIVVEPDIDYFKDPGAPPAAGGVPKSTHGRVDRSDRGLHPPVDCGSPRGRTGICATLYDHFRLTRRPEVFGATDPITLSIRAQVTPRAASVQNGEVPAADTLHRASAVVDRESWHSAVYRLTV